MPKSFTSDTAVIILAAGKGTRMKSELPKVMHKIASKPMVMHVMDAAKSLSPLINIAVLGEGMEEAQALLNKEATVILQKDRLGTAHAVQQAMPAFYNAKQAAYALVLYGDTPLITVDTLSAMRDAANNGADMVVLGFRTKNPAEYGRLIADGNGNLKGIVEFKETTPEQRNINLCNSGVMLISRDILETQLDRISNNNSKGEYYLTDLVELAVKADKNCCYVEGSEEEMLGVNDRIQLAEAENTLQQRLRKQAMLNGATLIAPETIFLSADTTLGKDVIIHPHVVCGPKVTIESGAEIKSFSHIEGATIHKNAAIGPYARLRPGADIGKNAKIGNFVEIKKAAIHDGAKINHLSYIGDAQIGADVNIGAGTITCNYDGVNKYRTHIGKGAFIGSNTSLVAPLNIGDGAIIAAGSTITDDIGTDDLAIARSPQVIKEKRANLLRKITKKH